MKCCSIQVATEEYVLRTIDINKLCMCKTDRGRIMHNLMLKRYDAEYKIQKWMNTHVQPGKTIWFT